MAHQDDGPADLIVNGLLFYLLALIVPVILTADSIVAVILGGVGDERNHHLLGSDPGIRQSTSQ